MNLGQALSFMSPSLPWSNALLATPPAVQNPTVAQVPYLPNAPAPVIDPPPVLGTEFPIPQLQLSAMPPVPQQNIEDRRRRTPIIVQPSDKMPAFQTSSLPVESPIGPASWVTDFLKEDPLTGTSNNDFTSDSNPLSNLVDSLLGTDASTNDNIVSNAIQSSLPQSQDPNFMSQALPKLTGTGANLLGSLLRGKNILGSLTDPNSLGGNLAGNLLSLLGDNPVEKTALNLGGRAGIPMLSNLLQGENLFNGMFNVAAPSMPVAGLNFAMNIIPSILKGNFGPETAAAALPAAIFSMVPGIGWILGPLMGLAGGIINEKPSRHEQVADSWIEEIQKVLSGRTNQIESQFATELGATEDDLKRMQFGIGPYAQLMAAPLEDLEKAKNLTKAEMYDTDLYYLKDVDKALIDRAIQLKLANSYYQDPGRLLPDMPSTIIEGLKGKKKIDAQRNWYTEQLLRLFQEDQWLKNTPEATARLVAYALPRLIQGGYFTKGFGDWVGTEPYKVETGYVDSNPYGD